MCKNNTRADFKAGGAVLTAKRHNALTNNKKPAGYRGKCTAGFNGLLMGGYHGK